MIVAKLPHDTFCQAYRIALTPLREADDFFGDQGGDVSLTVSDI
jgi:hypothetical protein